MATQTTVLKLQKPATTDTVDITVLNENFDKIDRAIYYGSNAPSTPFEGMIWLKPRS